MATTTASLTLSSGDLTGDALSLSTSTQLTKAGTVTGLDQTTGVARKTFTTTSIQTLIAKGDFSDDKAHKVYVRNTSTTATENLIVTIESQLLGRLYAGDFMFIPFNGDQDIKITPSVATAMTVEFLVIYEA
jgi:hypothetical protein|tara:strand:- start:819 stop:1214 length:396 start_codon:yes stop_codon:yes gene_type:complete